MERKVEARIVKEALKYISAAAGIMETTVRDSTAQAIE